MNGAAAAAQLAATCGYESVHVRIGVRPDSVRKDVAAVAAKIRNLSNGSGHEVPVGFWYQGSRTYASPPSVSVGCDPWASGGSGAS